MIRCFCDGLWWLTLTVRRNEKNGERVERLPLNHYRMTSNFGKKNIAVLGKVFEIKPLHLKYNKIK